MKNAIIIISSQQKGFLVSVGKILAEYYNVIFLARDLNVRNLINKLIPGATVDVQPDMNNSRIDDVITSSLRYELTYGERFSMLCSYDRGLGQGYLFNVDRYPMIGRSQWSQERKYGVLLNKFEYYEEMFRRYNPSLLLSLTVDKIIWLVARKREVRYFGLGLVKYKTRKFWYDEPEYVSSLFRDAVSRWLKAYRPENAGENVLYEQEVGSHYINSRIRFSYWRSFVEAVYRVVIETFHKLRGVAKKDSYRYLGWLPSRFGRVNMFRYIQLHGKRIRDLRGKQIVYFPLHLEPEIALLSVSPEFSNSMEIIAWISKSLPANAVLVIKEHLTCLGMRSKRFYDMLRRIPNVFIAHPEESSWDWIKASSIVSTITGTAAIEAVFFDKPVLSFGKYQIVNLLPTVYFASDYAGTRTAVGHLLGGDMDSTLFHKAKWALFKAQMEVSFELPGFEKTYNDTEFQDDLAAMAVEHLFYYYSELTQ